MSSEFDFRGLSVARSGSSWSFVAPWYRQSSTTDPLFAVWFLHPVMPVTPAIRLASMPVE
jgi:hypothetical protein